VGLCCCQPEPLLTSRRNRMRNYRRCLPARWSAAGGRRDGEERTAFRPPLNGEAAGCAAVPLLPRGGARLATERGRD